MMDVLDLLALAVAVFGLGTFVALSFFDYDATYGRYAESSMFAKVFYFADRHRFGI